ncbi:hypothetical protein BC936DRAFT_142454 [Jimgerdemannia flammicorona]|uniref:Uncharacterized protein n=1 Tax=Jimgerdemannia flammicorona TaxID=994334 RepID=A0A433A0U2_9FUNG|nr:hypothetical protein BC936DRAFT_142454 [Jimgerdemannia flammicorona]
MLSLVCDTPIARAAHGFDILVQCPSGSLVRRCCPSGAPFLELGVGYGEVDGLAVGVDRDHVAVAHQRDRATLLRLRRDVPDDEALERKLEEGEGRTYVTAAGEATVGEESHVLAEAGAHDGARGFYWHMEGN